MNILNVENIKKQPKLDLVFKNENGDFVLTEYGQYVINSHAMHEFSRQIKADPTEKYYFSGIKTKLIVPKHIEKEIRALYSKNLEEESRLLTLWKENNRDYFEIKKRVKSVKEFLEGFSFDPTILNLNLEDFVQGYKYSKHNEKMFNELVSIRTDEFKTIKPEYKELWNEIKAEIKKKCELDRLDYDLKNARVEVSEKTYRLALNKLPYESTKGYDELKRQLTLHMSNLEFNNKD